MPVDNIVVPDLHADPRFGEASSLLQAFRHHHERLEKERDRLILEHLLDGKPANPKSQQDTMLRGRLADLNALPPLPIAPVAGVADLTDAVARGRAILSGETVAKPTDHAGRLAEIDRQILAIREAMLEQTDVVDEIAQQLTLEIATELKPAWDALQLHWYRSAQNFASVTRQVQDLRARITAAGVRSCTGTLAMPAVRSPLVLGDESIWDSEISGWRRILERLGILP